MRQKIALILTIGLASCEGFIGGAGHIYSEDNSPIDSVMVTILHDDNVVDSTYSDDTGFFDGRIFTGCVPDCPEVKFIFKKRDFVTDTLDLADYLEQAETGHRNELKIILARRRD